MNRVLGSLPLRAVDAHLAALYLSRIYDPTDRPTPRRLIQWEKRVRSWSYRHPADIDSFVQPDGRVVYDLDQLDRFAENWFR